jgi:hypothetical protein
MLMLHLMALVQSPILHPQMVCCDSFGNLCGQLEHIYRVSRLAQIVILIMKSASCVLLIKADNPAKLICILYG